MTEQLQPWQREMLRRMQSGKRLVIMQPRWPDKWLELLRVRITEVLRHD